MDLEPSDQDAESSEHSDSESSSEEEEEQPPAVEIDPPEDEEYIITPDRTKSPEGPNKSHLPELEPVELRAFPKPARQMRHSTTL